MTCLYLPDMIPYKIYDITYGATGESWFLIYRHGDWLQLPAKNFTPNYDGDDFSGYYVDDYGR